MNKGQVDYHALEELAALSPDGIIIYNLAQERIVFVNQPAIDLVSPNEKIEDISIRFLFEKVIPEDREHLKNQGLQLLNDRPMVADVEFRLLTGDKIKILTANAYVLGNKGYVVVDIKDITRPRQHNVYLVEFGARKNTLLDALVHQISGALSLTDSLLTQAEKYVGHEKESLRNYLSMIGANNRQCVDIINNLLQKEHGRSPDIYVRNSRVNVVEIVDYIYKQLQLSTRTKNISLVTNNPFIYVDTDEVKLLQVINNMASNAVKFTPDDGEIRFTVVEQDSGVVVSVSDTGIGIPENLRDSIFQRRSLAGRPGLNGEASHGLGLSICVDLVRLIQGRIWFETEEGLGSTFFVSIPKEVQLESRS
jgi:two-component system sensor histidine kinase VicK